MQKSEGKASILLSSPCRLLAELERLKADLGEAHRKEVEHNEGVTVASMELLTLKRGSEAKSKEIESLMVRFEKEEESHRKEVEVSALIPVETHGRI